MPQDQQDHPTRKYPLTGIAVISMIMLSAGCYKELPPQEQVQAPPAPVKQSVAQKPAQHDAGVAQPASSALGHAKRSAENTIHQAEQASQQTADSVDKDK